MVVECDVPADSGLGREAVGAAYFRDAYRAPLIHRDTSVVELFFAIFGHHPLYVKVLLIIRNAIARLCGLQTASVDEIMRTGVRQHYGVGDQIGPWPIFLINEREIVAGRDNKHLDFRLSVLKEGDSVTVSTICLVHNLAGKIYLYFVVPFHRFGMKMLMARAAAANRL